MTDACGAGLCADETPLSDTAEKRAEGFAGSGAPSSELRRRRKQRRAEKGREKPVLPTGCSRLLLHSCCAPCAGEIMERLLEAGIPYAVYFYNPNIHPKREYLIRKEENIRFCRRYGIEFIDADYDPQNWFALTKGQEEAPERGARCTTCFDMRLGKTAEYASQNGFDAIATSLGISRWKDLAQVDGCGFRVAEHYPGVTYWDFNWRRGGGAQRMLDLSKREGFYKQEYCGCSHSLRQTNAWRVANGRSPIVIGQEYYGEGAGRPEKKVGLVSVGEG